MFVQLVCCVDAMMCHVRCVEYVVCMVCGVCGACGVCGMWSVWSVVCVVCSTWCDASCVVLLRCFVWVLSGVV